jgi:hypothetical protein
MLGDNSELDLAALDLKHRIRKIALRENRLIFSIFVYCLPRADICEKSRGVERQVSRVFWNTSSLQNATLSRLAQPPPGDLQPTTDRERLPVLPEAAIDAV